MQPKLIESYSITREYKDKEVTIKGEVYDAPVTKSDISSFHTVVKLFVGKLNLERNIYFEPQLTDEELQKEVVNIADNLNRILP